MRVHNWHVALAEEVEKARDEAWVEYSRCIVFAARCVQAVTGTDHRSAFPPFASKQEAEAIIAEYGSLAALLTSVLGAPIHSAFAGRGDVVVIDTEEGEAAGVCLGNNCAFAAAKSKGLVFLPRTVIKTAWRC